MANGDDTTPKASTSQASTSQSSSLPERISPPPGVVAPAEAAVPTKISELYRLTSPQILPHRLYYAKIVNQIEQQLSELIQKISAPESEEELTQNLANLPTIQKDLKRYRSSLVNIDKAYYTVRGAEQEKERRRSSGYAPPQGRVIINPNDPTLQQAGEEEEDQEENAPPPSGSGRGGGGDPDEDPDDAYLDAAEEEDDDDNLDPAMAGAGRRRAPLHPMQGSQLTSIPLFSGDDSSNYELWEKCIENAQVSYIWTDTQTACAVKSRLTGLASKYLLALEKMYKPGLNRWTEGVENLQEYLRNNYMPRVSRVAAGEAVTGLIQRPKETVSDFFARVVNAMDKKNYATTDKTTPAYLDQFKADLYTFFSCGLKDEIRKVIFANPSLETAAVSAAKSEPSMMEEMKKEIEALKKKLNKPPSGNGRGRGGGRGGSRGGRGRGRGGKGTSSTSDKCFYCDNIGHWERDCRIKKRDQKKQSDSVDIDYYWSGN